MVYDHIVKYNGKYYPAGEEVPENAESLSTENIPEVSDEDIALETDSVAETKYSGKRGRPKKSE